MHDRFRFSAISSELLKRFTNYRIGDLVCIKESTLEWFDDSVALVVGISMLRKPQKDCWIRVMLSDGKIIGFPEGMIELVSRGHVSTSARGIEGERGVE